MLIPEHPPLEQSQQTENEHKPNLLLGSVSRFMWLATVLITNWTRRELAKDSTRSIVLGAIAAVFLAIGFEASKENPEKRIASGSIAFICCVFALRAAQRWEQDSSLDRTLKNVELDDIAASLTDESEAKALRRRIELGLPNPQTELAALRQDMQSLAIASMSDGSAVPVNQAAIFPVEDLAQTIADSESDESNFLFVGKSRSGKTSVIVNAMAKKSSRDRVHWYVFNGKPERDNAWGGLVKTDSYWAVNSKERAVSMLGQFQACLKQLQQWQDSETGEHSPMFVVSDEVNNQRKLLNKVQNKKFDNTSTVYCTQCMSERSGWWISTHSHGVDEIGLDKKYQTSFQLVSLGREGKYETLEAAIDDRFVIRSKAKREELRAKLDAYQSLGGTEALAFTNQGGMCRIVRLPHYSKDVSIVSNRAIANAIDTPEDFPVANAEDMRDELNTMLNDALSKELSDEPQETEEEAAQNSPEESQPKVPKRQFNADLLPEKGDEFLSYLLEKEGRLFNTRVLFQNWGKRRFPTGVDEFKSFLARLISAGAIVANDAELNEFTVLIRSI